MADRHAADKRLLGATFGATSQCVGLFCGCETDALGVGGDHCC
jgi:hypothetical protein